MEAQETEKIRKAANSETAIRDDALRIRSRHESAHQAIKAREEGKSGGIVCIAYGNGRPRSKMSAARLFPYFDANGWKITNDFRKAD